MERAEILVVIAGSAGAVGVLCETIAALPPDLSAAIAIVQHRASSASDVLASILARSTALRVREAREGLILEPGTVYIAPPNLHLTITKRRRLHLVDGHRIRSVRSSANPLFESAAEVYGEKALAIVLSGYDADGTDGVQAIAEGGGTVLAQDPATSFASSMPLHAIATGAVDRLVTADQLANEIVSFVANRRRAA